MSDDGCETGFVLGCAPGGNLIVGQRFGGPLALVFDENLKAVASGAKSVGEGVFEPAGDGHVRTEALRDHRTRRPQS